MAKIGFIGMGNMGYAMLKGALAAFSPSDIIFSSPDREKCERISSETGVRFAESNAECGNNAKYIVLAVKPQMYPTLPNEVKNLSKHLFHQMNNQMHYMLLLSFLPR